MPSPVIFAGFILAAAVGGVTRFAIGQRYSPLIGTLLANVSASVLLGWVSSAGETSYLIVGTGFAGALSTWSTFANELTGLLRSGRFKTAFFYFTATVITGVAGAYFGLQLN